MIKQNLTQIWGSSKFAPSWIVGTADIGQATSEIMDFVQSIMECGSLPLENNPDFSIITREPNSTGNLSSSITVDQIRGLQKFFSTTKAVSKYKVALIQEADTMNVNASNCCLKILEDTPQNGFIFLVTKSPASLLPTIRSRCQKLHFTDDTEEFDEIAFEESLRLIIDNKSFLQKLSGKIDKATLQDFGRNTLYFLSRVIKNNELSSLEEECYNLLKSKSRMVLLHKFEAIEKIVLDCQKFDLDQRAAFVLMVETFRS